MQAYEEIEGLDRSLEYALRIKRLYDREIFDLSCDEVAVPKSAYPVPPHRRTFASASTCASPASSKKKEEDVKGDDKETQELRAKLKTVCEEIRYSWEGEILSLSQAEDKAWEECLKAYKKMQDMENAQFIQCLGYIDFCDFFKDAGLLYSACPAPPSHTLTFAPASTSASTTTLRGKPSDHDG